MIDLKDLCNGIDSARKEKGFVSLRAYPTGEESFENEYLLFIKPELLRAAPASTAPIEVVFERLAAFDQRVTAASVLHASYILRHRIMDKHYGAINAVSRLGKKSLSEAALARLPDLGSEKGLGRATVLGAHEFLSTYEYFSPKALAVLSDNLASTKIGPGTYCVPITLEGTTVLVLNAFHPEQLQRYTTNDSVIAALVLTSTSRWKQIRTSLTGATNPRNAPVDSIRGTLLRRRQELGLAEVNTGANGVHVSAGPIEGMVEIVRFMSDFDQGREIGLEQTNMGRLLGAAGFSARGISHLATNPMLQLNDTHVSVFDYTEESDSPFAAQCLAVASPAYSHEAQ
jgi:hypothetical protein